MSFNNYEDMRTYIYHEKNNKINNLDLKNLKYKLKKSKFMTFCDTQN
jgi:ribosomal protein S2